MSILDDPFWQEDGAKFCAEMDRQVRAIMKPLGPAGWRARRCFRIIEQTRAEWDSRAMPTIWRHRSDTLYFVFLSKGKSNMRASPGKVFFCIDRPLYVSNAHSKDACLLVLCGHHVRAEPWCELPPHVFHEIPRADAEALKDCFGCGEICEDGGAPEWWRAMVSIFPAARWLELDLGTYS